MLILLTNILKMPNSGAWVLRNLMIKGCVAKRSESERITAN